MSELKLTQEFVDRCLDYAVKQNDYKEILDWPAIDIAHDMLAFDDDTYATGAAPEQLIPYIEDWLRRNKP